MQCGRAVTTVAVPAVVVVAVPGARHGGLEEVVDTAAARLAPNHLAPPAGRLSIAAITGLPTCQSPAPLSVQTSPATTATGLQHTLGSHSHLLLTTLQYCRQTSQTSQSFIYLQQDTINKKSVLCTCWSSAYIQPTRPPDRPHDQVTILSAAHMSPGWHGCARLCAVRATLHCAGGKPRLSGECGLRCGAV